MDRGIPEGRLEAPAVRCRVLRGGLDSDEDPRAVPASWLGSPKAEDLAQTIRAIDNDIDTRFSTPSERRKYGVTWWEVV